MKKVIYNINIIFLLSLLLSLGTSARGEAMQISFMGRLANFDGVVATLWSKIAVDKERSEVFTLNPRQRDVRIYNEAGMQTFGFGENIQVAGATDIELDEEGNIYLLYPRVPDYAMLKLDYKGDPLGHITIKRLPEEYRPFQPDQFQYQQGRFYLADTGTMDVVVADINGNYQQGYHLKEGILSLEEQFADRPGEEVFQDPDKLKFLDMTGFCVDTQGNIYFTIATLFSAFKLLPEIGVIKTFGTAGSGPGKFGVVAAITTDKYDNIYITDRLRSVVMVFDSSFSLVTEFGFRGLGPGNLIVPDDVSVDDQNGFIYVAQAANRGVSVFRVTRETDS